MNRIFISYSHKDKKIVQDWLIPVLENQCLNTYVDFKDFEIGIPSLLNMERGIEKCEKTILILTKNWLESEFTQFEALLLQAENPLNLNKRILPLLFEKCDLPKRLKMYTYADFTDESQREIQIGRLITQIRKDFGKVSKTNF